MIDWKVIVKECQWCKHFLSILIDSLCVSQRKTALCNLKNYLEEKCFQVLISEFRKSIANKSKNTNNKKQIGKQMAKFIKLSIYQHWAERIGVPWLKEERKVTLSSQGLNLPAAIYSSSWRKDRAVFKSVPASCSYCSFRPWGTQEQSLLKRFTFEPAWRMQCFE